MIEYRMATVEDLNSVWDKDIERNPGDDRWRRWKKEYLDYNENNELKTFVAVDVGNVIAQISVVLKPNVKAVLGKEALCDGKEIANMNAFRCDKEYEGKGHISKLVKLGEDYARRLGYKFMSIGSEARESRNLAIYLHFGYNEFVMYEFDDEEEGNPLVLYYRKRL